MDLIRSAFREPQCAITGSAVYKCPRAACSGFAFPPLMQCTLCRCLIDTESCVGPPPSKLPKLSSSHVKSPVLILSVGKSGIFDARHTPCVITASHLSCSVKVEGLSKLFCIQSLGTWCPVNVRPSEVQVMVFCEELQVVFLKPRDNLKLSLVETLKLDSSRIPDQNFMKWVILVLGQHMTNSPCDNVSVQQMELFASTIRENDGFCKMDCSLLEARKLLLDCGLRLPRAEARMQRNTCAAGNISREQLYSDTPPQSTIGDVLTQVTSSQSQSTSNLPSRTEGGLLTNVLNTLSSTGMYLLGQPSCPSNNVADGLQSTQNAVDEDNDDLIILSEESADCSRTSSPPILSSAAGPKPNSSTAPQTQSFKFDYKPPGSTDSVTLTQADFDCLAPGGLLNDAIINFYLKYLYFEQLTDVQRQATYLFNCFFYSRLAGVSPTPVVNNCRPPTANPPTANVTTGQNNASGFVGHIPESSKARHANVAKWTRRVDLFCKDYIIIPINEAIGLHHASSFQFVCLNDDSPILRENSLRGLERQFTDRNVRGSNLTSAPRLPLPRLGKPGSIPALTLPSGSMAVRHRKDATANKLIFFLGGGNSHWFLGLVCYPWMAGMVSYTALYRAAAFDLCQLTNEFLDVDLIKFPNDVDDKTISQEPIERRSDDPKGVAFDRWRRRRLAWLRSRGINAMPCILLFDSLPCQTRVEWDSRRSEQDGPLHFDKDTIRGFSPRVPSQSNLVDCGIYLLHYVEMFFKQPVQSYTKDYFQNEMSSWFSDDTVGQKRADIRTLLARLNERYHAEERTD
ncbi:hypothetical protein T265_09054 [Opisthorchis viverrini]|uniref:Ubiquitin-like protease family profile domain-containing protein n=1 Tax=Opisthorchis viverrini TaxID=6198 RepID=A0A074ZI39_OPIVI|nr:hypothetical protein T265_09054 [Opisthorchis viverrini]KER22970.1 hypothetical protein T265_09054 [Opisthorchis viverrini]